MLMLAGSLAAIGCEQSYKDRTSDKVTTEDVRRENIQADKPAATHAELGKEEYQQQLDTRLTQMDAEIAKLREKHRDLKDEAKAQWERTLPELQAKRDSVRVKLAEVRESSADAWNDAKNGAQRAWEDLDSAFREASRHF
jgi:hypothetical protein